MTGSPWDASYENGPAPWDTGRPQRAVVRLASEASFDGAVLDVGCGTGENTLHIAAMGLPVLGVDVAEAAVEIARDKAKERGVEVEFETADALELDSLGRTFDVVLDCGLFHTFDSEERLRYASSLGSVTRHDGILYILCFADGGRDIGPHPVTRGELEAIFQPETGWKITSIDPELLETTFHDNGAPAWLATISRI